MDWGRGGCSGVGLGGVDRVRGRRLCLGQVLLEGALAEHRRSGAAREWDALGAARLWMREKGSMTWEAVGGSATCTHTAVAPRSDGDFGAEMTTSMLPSSAGTVPTFTVVCFSDMMLIEFTRTYDGCISGNLGWRLQTTAEYYRALLLVTGDCAEHYYHYWRLCRAPLLLITGDCAEHYCAEHHYYYYWRLCRALLSLMGTGDCAEYYYWGLDTMQSTTVLVTADCGLLQTLRITGYCRTAELRTTAHYYWLLETVQSTTAHYTGYCRTAHVSHLSASED